MWKVVNGPDNNLQSILSNSQRSVADALSVGKLLLCRSLSQYINFQPIQSDDTAVETVKKGKKKRKDFLRLRPQLTCARHMGTAFAAWHRATADFGSGEIRGPKVEWINSASTGIATESGTGVIDRSTGCCCTEKEQKNKSTFNAWNLFDRLARYREKCELSTLWQTDRQTDCLTPALPTTSLLEQERAIGDEYRTLTPKAEQWSCNRIRHAHLTARGRSRDELGCSSAIVSTHSVGGCNMETVERRKGRNLLWLFCWTICVVHSNDCARQFAEWCRLIGEMQMQMKLN